VSNFAVSTMKYYIVTRSLLRKFCTGFLTPRTAIKGLDEFLGNRIAAYLNRQVMEQVPTVCLSVCLSVYSDHVGKADTIRLY
jgi:hypothetical protein